MPVLDLDKLRAYRHQTFRTAPGLRLRSKEQAIDYANERGFLFFWPIKDILFPSLWTAVAGDRPVADEHDDPGHITWGWKDSLLGKGVWYYARILRRRNTIISLNLAPYFYALTSNYGDYEQDYLLDYHQGRLTLEAKLVYEALLTNGVMDTISLRKAARLSSSEANARFAKALDDLMVDFKILPVAVTEAGAWHYSHAYDIVARHQPDMVENARFLQELPARRKIIETYFRSVGAAQLADLKKLFRWEFPVLKQAIGSLIEQQILVSDVIIQGIKGSMYGLKELVEENGHV